ncbi:alcohol dehydrogenase catalytic domain-containing protein [Bacillus sp. FJAT-50079]|uniref:alcohol dehydrogenase catalytic domain-containing protein n=1 Tax=Bacillus sp. FJAT-50079 TaxID=2833577 RepID=UPI001BC8E46D|nr:alcohol dehydrogenase catalytic domain-containing protein [Bacillus sp. FJAT-50079]MBS4206599.1 alcohol dehydrogenase catalytic domain-containing protein [Bacillus sp. FJAT-50079]
MRSARFVGENKIEIKDIELPTLFNEDDVIVKVTCCGLCGSDKRLFKEGSPYTPGHEIAGIVHKVGPKAQIKPGTRVIIYIPIFCGNCKFCLAGETNRCQHIDGLIGWQRDGGYAEYVLVPSKNLIPIPDDITDSDGVLLLDTVGTAAHAIRMATRLNVSPTSDSKVLVVGCGPLGLGTILTFQAMGYSEIYAVDPVEDRLTIAEEFGATRYTSDIDLKGEFSIVIEASGSAPGRKTAIYAVEPGGAVVILGESNDPFVIHPTPQLRRKDFYLIRSFYFNLNEVKDNIELYRKNQNSFQKLVSKIVTFDQLQDTFIEFSQGKTIKPFVKLNS